MDEDLAALERAFRTPPSPSFGREFRAWLGRALSCGLPSALCALMLGLSLGQWLAVVVGVACHVALFAWCTLRFAHGSTLLATFIRALAVAVRVRAIWCVLAVIALGTIPPARYWFGGVVAAPVMADFVAGVALTDFVNGKLADPDVELEPDTERQRPDRRWVDVGQFGDSYLRVLIVTLLQGVAVALQLGLIAVGVLGVQRLRARSAPRAKA